MPFKRLAGAIRLLENPLGNQLRSLERLASQSKILSSVFQAAFPLVGAVAAVSMLSRLGTEIAEAVKKVQEMPKAVTAGFNSLHLAAASSADSLRLTNDELSNSIAKLQGKGQNNLAIQLDEARIKADDLAKSLEQDAQKVAQLLSANKLASWSTLLGKAGTGSVSGSVTSFNNDLTSLGGQYADATRSGNTGLAADLKKQIADKQSAALEWSRQQQYFRQHPDLVTNDMNMQDMAGDQSGNLAILKGFSGTIRDSQDLQSQKDANGKLVAQDKAAQAAHTAAEKAAEARRKEAEEMAKGWATSLELAKQADTLARDMASFASQSNLEFFKTAGVSADDNAQLTAAGKATNDWITSLRAGFDAVNANKTAISENSIQMAVATGQMTRQDAALALAALNTDTYTASLAKLQALRESINNNSHLSDQEKQAQLNNNSTAQGNLAATYQMQQAAYQQTANPASSSAIVGFKQALNDYTEAAKDNAAMMRNIVDNTLRSLNDQLVNGMTGKGFDGKAFGAGVFTDISKTFLQKAEGSLFGAFGIKNPNAQLGTQSNPMIVQFATGGVGSGSSTSSSGGLGSIFSQLFGKSKGSTSGASSIFGDLGGGDATGSGINPLSNAQQKSFLFDQLMPRFQNGLSFGGGGDSDSGGGLFSDLFGGGDDNGSFMSSLKDVVPFMATGGPINGPAVVGEQGPELFVPNTSGHIVPNHKLKSSSSGAGGDGGVHFHEGAIDARGANDPAQVAAQVHRAIMQAAPSIMAGAVQMGKSQQQRRPSSAR